MKATEIETCEFISSHIAELTKLAVAAELHVLTYLLRIAQIEADSVVITKTKARRAA